MLKLATLLQQRIALGSQYLVNALVIAPANVAYELSEYLGILDGVCRTLPNLCRGSPNDEACDRRRILGIYSGLERLVLRGGSQVTIRNTGFDRGSMGTGRRLALGGRSGSRARR